jgi:hypothetical protein
MPIKGNKLNGNGNYFKLCNWLRQIPATLARAV